MRAREWDWLITDSALPEGTPKKLSRYAAVLGGKSGARWDIERRGWAGGG
jgi:hypothetical protein